MQDRLSIRTAVGHERFTDRRSITRTTATLTGLVLFALVANVAAVLAAVALVDGGQGSAAVFAASTIGTQLSFLAVGAVYLRYRTSFPLQVRAPTREELSYVLGGLLASFLTLSLSFAATDAIVPAFDLLPGFMEYTGFGGLSDTALAAGAVLSLAVVAPVEEFFFRGLVQRRLREALSPASAIGVSGATFAFFHVYTVALLSPPGLVLVHLMAYYTAVGMIFGYVYYRTETVAAPAAVHGMFNVILFAGLLLA